MWYIYCAHGKKMHYRRERCLVNKFSQIPTGSFICLGLACHAELFAVQQLENQASVSMHTQDT